MPAPRRAASYLRRLWPLALEAWRRWDNLSPQQKESYKRRARGYADQARKAMQSRGSGGGRRGRRR
jgi:hypothetical protein